MTELNDSPYIIMLKLCILYNFIQKYREGIFKLIDSQYDCDWYFGTNKTDIVGFDATVLKKVVMLKNIVIHRPYYWQKNAVKLIFNKNYNYYLILGETICLSTWIIGLCSKLFYPQKKIYFWSHGWYGRETLTKRILKRIYFSLADDIFLYGNYAKNLMIKEGFVPERLHVIHNSLDYERQVNIRQQLVSNNVYKNYFKNSDKTILFIGRLTAEKRLDLLIDALSLLRNKRQSFNLILIGDGIAKDDLKKRVCQAGLENNVWFYGKCYEEEENANLIFNADLCVSPGNVGLTAIHAMTYGIPVITHSNFKYQGPEFEAIRPGITGDFFQYNNPISLADVILSWFREHCEDKEIVRQNCYNEIDSYWTPQYQFNIINTVLNKTQTF